MCIAMLPVAAVCCRMWQFLHGTMSRYICSEHWQVGYPWLQGRSWQVCCILNRFLTQDVISMRLEKQLPASPPSPPSAPCSASRPVSPGESESASCGERPFFRGFIFPRCQRSNWHISPGNHSRHDLCPPRKSQRREGNQKYSRRRTAFLELMLCFLTMSRAKIDPAEAVESVIASNWA